MQHTNDVQLLRSLHEEKKFYRKTYHFKFSLECAHVHVHLHDCLSSSSIFFFCQNHLTLPFQSLFVHLRWFSIFSVFFFDSAAETSHRIWKNCLKRTQKPTKPFHFPSYSIQFDSIETKDLEEKKLRFIDCHLERIDKGKRTPL